MLISCGKRQPPLPPIERVPQRTEIGGVQRGSRIILSWTTPARNAAAGSVLNIDRIDIYRLAEPLDSPLVLTEEEFASRATLIATVPIAESDFGRQEMRYEDDLALAGQKARLRYAARYANRSGQKAAYSNFFLIEPAARVAEPPLLAALEPSQDAVTIRWSPPARNIDGSDPANIIGYNVYRSDGTAVRKLNSSPVTSESFADRFFEFGRTYVYQVRTVSLGIDAAPVESLDSRELSIVATDTFAPAPPSSITVAASPGTVSVFFAANVETDVKGYRVYRSEDRDAPLASWTLLTLDPVPTNTYQDRTVESGRRYFYYLTAVDRAGNVSGPSEIVGETVP